MNFKDLIKTQPINNQNKDLELYADVANLVTEARLHKGLTQAKLAKIVGTQQPSIARIENGTTLPSLSFLLRIAKAVDTYLIAPKFGFMLTDSNKSTVVAKDSISFNSFIASDLRLFTSDQIIRSDNWSKRSLELIATKS